MIKVTVLYPNVSGPNVSGPNESGPNSEGPDNAGTTFDMAYYTSKHMPMVQRKCGPPCRSIGAELGLGGGEPGSKPPYIAIGYLTFDSVEAFQKSFGPHIAEIMADIPNYTNATPVIQISEIKL
jgi:uncharacterized protein (TIGR02118 family)